MLETIDLSLPKMKKEDYRAQRDALVDELVVLQQQAHERGVGLVVLFEGWDGAGKGSRISDLMYKLDARATAVHVTENLDTKALRDFAGLKHGVTGMHPLMQEFWQALGMRGTITFYDRGWYTTAVQYMMFAEKEEHQDALFAREKLQQYLAEAADFEKQLVDDGYIVVKFFVHVTKEAQRDRLKRLHDDPATRWRVSERKLGSWKDYEQAYRLYDNLLEGSDFAYAPWQVLNGEDKRSANLAIVRTLVERLREALAAGEDPAEAAARAAASANSAKATVKGQQGSDAADAEAHVQVDAEAHAQAAAEAAAAHAQAPKASRFAMAVDAPRVAEIRHDLVLSREDYRKQLKREQKRFNALEMRMYQERVPLMLVYEGWDAAGKGGSIKRVAQAIDARAYTIFPSPAPTKPELLHPFLWRYWTRLPKAGHVGIYDRSWYGRVLVERVEGFASPREWSRAYDEINEFERDMVSWGALLLKFWVNVSPEEQLRRFQERQNDPMKQWKITEEDWRNRDKYPQYEAAIDDMFRLTSTPFAPWRILESDDKLHARVKALKIINEALEERLGK